MNDTLILRRALSDDFEGIFQLQQENFSGNLSETDKPDGFLTVSFTLEQIKELADNGVTVVATTGVGVVGFLSTQTCAYNQSIPIAKKLIDTLQARSGGPPFDLSTSLVCGPVCIKREFRGQGILERMYQRLAQEARETFPTGITFVSRENPRSLYAHEVKLGMTTAGAFEHAGKEFAIFLVYFDQYL
jgi:hypothetical protein